MRQEEDISPWTQTEHDDIQHQKLKNSSIKNKSAAHLTFLQFDIGNGNGQGGRNRHPTLEPIIITPQLFRNKSIKDAPLPKINVKVEGPFERRGSFRSGQLLPLTKSLSKTDLEARSNKGTTIFDPSTQLLRAKLQGMLKTNDHPQPITISRNLSQVHPRKNDLIIRENNIVFLYSPHSNLKKPNESPKKKTVNHVLDRLLSDWN